MPANRLDFLLRPSRTAAAFAARTTASALLALVLAVLLGPGNPYWSAMTVVVVSQPLRGQVMAKGFYRL
ncbi:MAG: FUSC family protein, partial [Thermomicrobiales bacterium]